MITLRANRKDQETILTNNQRIKRNNKK